jgi:DNA-binding GntR family transcriptional regulator
MPRLPEVKFVPNGGELGSLSDQAYRKIRERILHGDLSVGAKLPRRKLAAELRVSPVPVMDALQRLEHEGLVESRSRVGTRVRVPTSEDIRDQFTLREALEAHAARMYSEKATPDQKHELLVMASSLDDLDAQIEKSKDGDQRQQLVLAEHRLHKRLHLRIARCAGCAALTNAIEINQALIFKWLLDLIPRLRLPARWHQRLIEGVNVDDPAAAESIMREHIRHGFDNVMRCIKTEPLSRVRRNVISVFPDNGASNTLA